MINRHSNSLEGGICVVRGWFLNEIKDALISLKRYAQEPLAPKRDLSKPKNRQTGDFLFILSMSK